MDSHPTCSRRRCEPGGLLPRVERTDRRVPDGVVWHSSTDSYPERHERGLGRRSGARGDCQVAHSWHAPPRSLRRCFRAAITCGEGAADAPCHRRLGKATGAIGPVVGILRVRRSRCRVCYSLPHRSRRAVGNGDALDPASARGCSGGDNWRGLCACSAGRVWHCVCRLHRRRRGGGPCPRLRRLPACPIWADATVAALGVQHPA